MRTTTFTVLVGLLAAGAAVTALPDGLSPGAAASAAAADPVARAKAILAKMNLTEKIAMCHGASGPYVGNIVPNARLGIPSIRMNDGPQGFRYNDGHGTTTQWPSGLSVAATWARESMLAFGTGMGKEFNAKGANVQLGPGVCVARVPRNGRNFEYLSGEDPYLGYQMVQPVVRGIQSQGVIANAKHYINNNQETNRGNVSENVDERTRMEIYHPPFQGAVDAGVMSIMCSYNRINGVHACENNQTLNTELKGIGGFQGWVMSDWGGTHSTVLAANSGLDQEMPGDGFFGPNLMAAVQNGSVAEATVDDKVLRMLIALFRIGAFDTPMTGNITANVTSVAHNTLARELAANATLLLKNEGGLLPLDAKTLKSIAVIGPAAGAGVITGGGGSGEVVPYYQVNPLQGVAEAVAGKPMPPRPATCKMEQGYDYYQPGNPSAQAQSAQDCCAQCASRVGCNAWTFQQGQLGPPGTCWFKPNNAGRRQHSGLVSGTCTQPTPVPANVMYDDGTNLTRAVDVAKGADVALVVVATTSSEGHDRDSLSFGSLSSVDQDALATAITGANPRTIVVGVTPGAVLTPWADAAAAVVLQFMPGQEEGHALADVLFGAVNPAARLPLTMPNIPNEEQFTQAQWPGLPAGNTPLNAVYSEKLEVGYRWYDAHGVKPKFAFGHGLSYTSFAYSNLAVSGRTVSFDVANTGKVAGDEVPQVYLAFPSAAGEPPMQLKGFDRVSLAAGAKTTLSFTMSDRDLSIWSVADGAWVAQKGAFGVHVGASSRDIRLTGTLNN